MVLPPNLPPGEKPHILVTHDESPFDANDGKRKLWMEKEKQSIRVKGKETELWFPNSLQQEAV